jgi:hypothetical protein
MEPLVTGLIVVVAFVLLNVFAAALYYGSEYRRRR